MSPGMLVPSGCTYLTGYCCSLHEQPSSAVQCIWTGPGPVHICRCPGCKEPWQQQVVESFLDEMSAFLRNAAPNQLISLGTEGGWLLCCAFACKLAADPPFVHLSNAVGCAGYFMDNANIGYNPGGANSLLVAWSGANCKQ